MNSYSERKEKPSKKKRQRNREVYRKDVKMAF